MSISVSGLGVDVGVGVEDCDGVFQREPRGEVPWIRVGFVTRRARLRPCHDHTVLQVNMRLK